MTGPGQLQESGGDERMHRTLEQEATVPPAASRREQKQKVDRLLAEGNRVRPREALVLRRPAQAHQSSSQPMRKRIGLCDLSHFVVRRVSQCGTIWMLSR